MRGLQLNHQETYHQNPEYADFLQGWDPHFHDKYTNRLRPNRPGDRVLDVGCGVGQVIERLAAGGFEVYGVDVSEPCIERARTNSPNCQIYDGKILPFPEGHFASAGAFNVLEHVEQPESFLEELVRVVKPGGKIVVSSPNFLRVLGFRDYHPKMRGIGNKLSNARRLLQKRRQMRLFPEEVRFDRMQPIVKEHFTPDDDAIVATNPLEMSFFLKRQGCSIQEVVCTDRNVWPPIDWLLNLTPLRFLIFNSFIVARKSD